MTQNRNRTLSTDQTNDRERRSAMAQSGDKQVSRRTMLQGTAALAAAGMVGFPNVRQAAAQGDTPVEGGSLSLGVSQITSNSHLLHLRHYAGSENIYTRLLANARLITLDTDRVTFVGALAESFEFNEDATLLTFKLRQGLTWHDGEPFTAKDVDFTYHMIGVPGVGPAVFLSTFVGTMVGAQEYIDGTADRISGLTVVDDFTVSFEIEPDINQWATLSLFNQICIAPDHILNQYLNRDTGSSILESPWATTAEHVGIGPFKVVEYVADQYIRYEPFENYYNGKPLLGEVVYRPYADAVTLAAALESGEIMVGRLPIGEVERFEQMSSLSIHSATSPSYQGAIINTRQPHLADKRVRQALLYAIDREAMAQVLYAGKVAVVHSPIEVPGIPESPTMKKYEYDPEQAKALLAEAGWDPNQVIYWDVAMVPSDEATLAYYATINDFWAQVGVKADFNVVGQDLSVLWGPDWPFNLYPSAYPIGIPAWVARDLDPRNAVGRSSAGFDAEGFTDLWDRAKSNLTGDEEIAAIHELQDVIAEEALALMIVRSPDIWGIGNNVHGLTPNYFPNEYDLYDWHLEKVWVDPA
jgi:ABC-type transport system substrate-binding protein